MERKILDPERSPRETMLFASICLGLLMALVGIVLSSVPMALIGLVFAVVGLSGFGLSRLPG